MRLIVVLHLESPNPLPHHQKISLMLSPSETSFMTVKIGSKPVCQIIHCTICSKRSQILEEEDESMFFFFFFLNLKGHWPRKNKNTIKKSRQSPVPVKRTVGEKKQGVEVRSTLEVS